MVDTDESLALRTDVMAKIACLGPSSLTAVSRFLQEMELAALMEDIADDADALRQAGQLDPRVLDDAIREHRRRHPYG